MHPTNQYRVEDYDVTVSYTNKVPGIFIYNDKND